MTKYHPQPKTIVRRHALILTAIVTLFASITPTVAQAMDVKFYAGNEILYHDPDAVSCSPGAASAAGSTTLIGNDNPEKIFNYFIGKGLTPAQAAGFLGNIEAESTINPNSQQPSMIVPDGTLPTDGQGFGLIQWTYTVRQAPLVALAKETNRKTTDLSLQLDYIWKELTDPALYAGQHWEKTLENLKATNTPTEAATSIHYDYERSGEWPGFPAIRGTMANKWLDKFKGADSSTTTATSTSTSNPCGSVGAGIGDFMSDKFKLFNQCDPPWGQMSVPSPDGTACQVACGPTSMAMIIFNMTGQNITPTDTINFVTQRNEWYGTGGTTMQTNKNIAEKWGLAAEVVPSSYSSTDIKAILDKGGMVMMAGLGATPYLASVNHYVVIKGITADGKYSIADPNGHSGEYDVSTIAAGIRNAGLGGVAVYKK